MMKTEKKKLEKEIKENREEEKDEKPSPAKKPTQDKHWKHAMGASQACASTLPWLGCRPTISAVFFCCDVA